MPVHRLAARGDLRARRRPGDEGPVRVGRPPATGGSPRPPRPSICRCPSDGEYVSELNLAGRAWVAEWAARLDQGAMLLVDYGYPRAEYYLPSRSTGTPLLLPPPRHGDPFLWPGLNDITAFVDFTAIAEAGFEAGLDVLGYTDQANLLFNCGCSTAWRAGRPRRHRLHPRRQGSSASPAPTRWASCSRSSPWAGHLPAPDRFPARRPPARPLAPHRDRRSAAGRSPPTTRHAGPHQAVRAVEVMRPGHQADQSRRRAARGSAGDGCYATTFDCSRPPERPFRGAR